MKGYRNSEGVIPADVYLENLNVILKEDAADWAKSNPNAIRILADPAPTQTTINKFRTVFCERFPIKIVEVTPDSLDAELS